jgi:hypothetical protein
MRIIHVTKCIQCRRGINSTYIRVGQRSLLNKVGYYCSNCDSHYDLNQKPYTKNEKPYTVGGRWSSLVKIPPLTCAQRDDTRLNFTEGENENNRAKDEVGRVGFEPTTPAMSRRYLNQARPPAHNIDYKTTFEWAKYLFA